MKPWNLIDLVFDEESTEHLARHAIMEYEAREVFWNDPTWARDGRLQPDDWYMIGWTDAGRPLTIVVTVLVNGQLRPYTGWTPSKAESRHLPRRR
ncbi:MAG: hypothetical protein ACYDAR_02345 [Thermomicrobiales bacterium]